MAATLIWLCGCETGTLGNGENDGGEIAAASNGGGGVPTFVTSPVRSGTYALKTPTDGFVRQQVNQLATTYFVRFYFRIGANPSNRISIFKSSNNNSPTAVRGFLLALKTDGKLEFLFDFTLSAATVIATSTDAVLTNAWNLIEMKLVRDISVGGMELYLNGVLQFSSFVTNTTSGTSSTTTRLFFGNDLSQPGTGQSGQDMYWDDLAAATVDYIGAGQVLGFQGKAGTPTYDAWSKSGGATAAECWSETPFSAGKYCFSSVLSDRQTMLLNDAAVAAAIGEGAVIHGAALVSVSANPSATNATALRLTRRLGGADTDGASINIGTSSPNVLRPSMTNGDSFGVFLPSRADLVAGTAEIGAVQNSSGNEVRVLDLWLMVDFLPAPPTPLNRDDGFPVEWLARLARDDFFPVDFRGAITLNRDEPAPVEWLGKLARDEHFPVEWLGTPNPFFVRNEKFPAEWTGLPSDQLLLIWRVLNRLNAALALQWLVVSGALNQNLQLQWQVKAPLVPLTLRWNVVGPLVALTSQDVQRPTSIQQKTP